MASSLKEIWEIDGLQIPVYIYRERRHNNRISITKKGANLRIPRSGADVLNGSYRSWARQWLIDQLRKRPEISSRFSGLQYETGHEVQTPHRDYVLKIQKSVRLTSSGKLLGNTIHLDINQSLPGTESSNAIRTLVSRVIGKDQLPRVTARIHKLNDDYFSQEIKKIRIKNNSTNWGSCSHTGNINISSRTLLAPFDVQDYIFVHELSHRIEMNHSRKYWALVRNVMPDYKNYEQWIKEHGHLCSF